MQRRILSSDRIVGTVPDDEQPGRFYVLGEGPGCNAKRCLIGPIVHGPYANDDPRFAEVPDAGTDELGKSD